MVGRLAITAAAVLALALAAPAFADNDSPKISFFAGPGADAHWQHDADDAAGDGNEQDVELATSADGGYAGLSVENVAGTPTSQYPSSSFDVKSDYNGASLGSPRLVVRFSDGGRAELRPLTNTTDWQTVGDGNWDNNGGTCGFVFQTSWAAVQACHPGTEVVSVFMVADPYGHTHWIDNLNTAGHLFNEAKDNRN